MSQTIPPPTAASHSATAGADRTSDRLFALIAPTTGGFPFLEGKGRRSRGAGEGSIFAPGPWQQITRAKFPGTFRRYHKGCPGACPVRPFYGLEGEGA